MVLGKRGLFSFGNGAEIENPLFRVSLRGFF